MSSSPAKKGKALAPVSTAAPARRTDHLCFIIGSQTPYCYDFNEILGLPEGFTYRNRFHVKWIDPSLVPSLRDFAFSPLGEAEARVLLVLRDADKNSLIPVRWGTITSVQQVGVVAYFEYALGDLVYYDADPDVATKQIAANTEAFRGAHPWLPGKERKPLDEREPSVFLSRVGYNFTTASSSDLEAWGNLAGAVTAAAVFADTEFLKIVSLEDSAGAEAPIQNNGFLVNPKETYRLKVFQTVPNPSGAPLKTHSIKCNSLGDDIEFLRDELQAVGKYDMLTFVLRPVRSRIRSTSALEIPFNPDASAAVPQVRSALFIPLTFAAPSPTQKALFCVAALIALFALFYPQILPAWIPVNVTSNVAMLALVVLLTGPANALQSIWPSVLTKG